MCCCCFFYLLTFKENIKVSWAAILWHFTFITFILYSVFIFSASQHITHYYLLEFRKRKVHLCSIQLNYLLLNAILSVIRTRA